MGRLNIAFHALLKQHSNRVVVTGLVPWRTGIERLVSTSHTITMSRHLRITSLLRRLQLLLMGHGRHVYLSRVVVEWWMVVFFTFLFHWSSRTQARCNKEFGLLAPTGIPTCIKSAASYPLLTSQQVLQSRWTYTKSSNYHDAEATSLH